MSDRTRRPRRVSKAVQLRDALRTHRLERNFSYDELAEAIGLERVSPATVRRFIEGGAKPHETTVYAVQMYLERAAGEERRSA